MEIAMAHDIDVWLSAEPGRFQDADESAYYVAAGFMLRRQIS
jgi:hypothetical protein